MSDAIETPVRTTRRAYKPRTKPAVHTTAAAPRVETKRADDIRDPNSDEVITRKSRGERSLNFYDIPPSMKRSGWDYQWWTISVLGEPVDGSVMAEAHEGGWRPVPASHMPAMLAPGDTKATIERRGQRLYMRPVHLTQQAKQEDYQAAEQQRKDRIEGALAGRPVGQQGLSDIRGVRPLAAEYDIHGELGSAEQRSARR